MADFSQLAHRVVQATIDATEPGEPQTPAQVNGRKGARPTKLPVEQRSGTVHKAPGPRSKRRGPGRDSSSYLSEPLLALISTNQL